MTDLDPGYAESSAETAVVASAGSGAETAAVASAGSGAAKKKPLYPRLLRLRHIRPNAWQRAALGEGAVGAGVLLAMADLASAWSIVVLPVAVAAVVKAHDALQGLLDKGVAAGEPAGEDDPAHSGDGRGL